MNKLEIVKSADTEPSKDKLWLNKGALKYYGPKGWKAITGEAKYYNVWTEGGGVSIELPAATDISLGGVRIMDKDDSHLLVSPEGNLYVYTTDNYYMPDGSTDTPDMIPTLAALHGLYMDTVHENQYATIDKAGITKQAKNLSSTSESTTIAELNAKLNSLIAKLQEAGIMVHD